MAEKKQRRNAGKATKRKDGRWQTSYVSKSGERHYFYADTQAEVNKKKRQAMLEDEQNILATGPDIALSVYLENWIEKVKKPNIALSTYDKYKWAIAKYINPSLGHIRVRMLTPQHVQSFYNEMIEGGLSAGTVKILKNVLNGAIKNAVKWTLVSRNVVALVTPPRREDYEARFLTIEQAHKLIDVAKKHRYRPLIIVALATGMRRGELLALRWSDIDFQEGRLFVRRSVNRLVGRGFVESKPKTKKGLRSILLPMTVLEILKEHQVQLKELQDKAGSKWKGLNLVFPNTFGSFIDPGGLKLRLDKFVVDAGLLHMRFHDLRHSSATIMLAMGIHPKVVQEILGHSTISITMDLYSHVLFSVQQDAASKVDDVFKGFFET